MKANETKSIANKPLPGLVVRTPVKAGGSDGYGFTAQTVK